MIGTGVLLNRTRAMAKQIVMDITGDTRHEFDPADAHAVAEAFARFEALTSEGFTAAVRTGSGTSELIHDFDPAGPTAIPSLRTGCRPPRRTRGGSLYSR